MATQITLPRLGWSMEEGVLVAWLKQPGEQVRAGEPLFTLEGDKAVEDVEAISDGILYVPPDSPKLGDTVAVGTTLGYLLSAGESAPLPSAAQPAVVVVEATAKQPAVAPSAKTSLSGNGTGAPANPSSVPRRGRGFPTISPRAAHIAAELGIDWTTLAGSGRTGRIREADVRQAAAMRVESPQFTDGRRVIQPSALRRTIARRMRDSVQNTAPVTLTTRCDATRLVALRRELKSAAGDAHVASYTDIIAKLSAVAIGKHPLLNARWEDEQIVVFDEVHIGIAVDSEDGLLVPVVRDVRKLSLGELARRSRDLVERARTRQLDASELEGGTFTITNLGALGIEAFTPIINYPQTAILGIGAILREAVVLDDDRIEPRDRLTLSLTFDHQVMDGADAARFLQSLRGLMESPLAALLD
ncbi:MAG: dihydrolipoamide acetyltransferase family protein [Pirellulales bacterium]